MIRDAARMADGGAGCSSNPDPDRHTDLDRQPTLTEPRVRGVKMECGAGGGDVQDAVSAAIVQLDGG